jgi:hypothetical protein
VSLCSDMSHWHVNKRNVFWYFCGQFTLQSEKRTVTSVITKAYNLYFGRDIGDHDNWVHYSCSVQAMNLRVWLNGK